MRGARDKGTEPSPIHEFLFRSFPPFEYMPVSDYRITWGWLQVDHLSASLLQEVATPASTTSSDYGLL